MKVGVPWVHVPVRNSSGLWRQQHRMLSLQGPTSTDEQWHRLLSCGTQIANISNFKICSGPELSPYSASQCQGIVGRHGDPSCLGCGGRSFERTFSGDLSKENPQAGSKARLTPLTHFLHLGPDSKAIPPAGDLSIQTHGLAGDVWHSNLGLEASRALGSSVLFLWYFLSAAPTKHKTEPSKIQNFQQKTRQFLWP